jgi:hypothetical protein
MTYFTIIKSLGVEGRKIIFIIIIIIIIIITTIH